MYYCKNKTPATLLINDLVMKCSTWYNQYNTTAAVNNCEKGVELHQNNNTSKYSSKNKYNTEKFRSTLSFKNN